MKDEDEELFQLYKEYLDKFVPEWNWDTVIIDLVK